MKWQIYLTSIVGENLLVFKALHSKVIMSKVRNCIFKEAVDVANNESNFHDNLDNWDKNQLLNWGQPNFLLKDWKNIFISELELWI